VDIITEGLFIVTADALFYLQNNILIFQ